MTASAQLSNRSLARASKCGPVGAKPVRAATHTRPPTAPPAPVLPVAPPMRSYVVPSAPWRSCSLAMGGATAARTRAPQSSRVLHLAAAVVVTLAVVGGLGWLGQTPSDGVPAETALIRVGAGETMWDVAQRVAPKSDQRAVVERIQQLNGMADSAIQPGQELQVPDGR